MKKLALLFLVASVGASTLLAQNPVPLLLQSPTLSKTQIAFAYGGSLWIVAREGGEARRLVVGDPGPASNPLFSPDGTQVAFTGRGPGCRRRTAPTDHAPGHRRRARLDARR